MQGRDPFSKKLVKMMLANLSNVGKRLILSLKRLSRIMLCLDLVRSSIESDIWFMVEAGE